MGTLNRSVNMVNIAKNHATYLTSAMISALLPMQAADFFHLRCAAAAAVTARATAAAALGTNNP
jgi:hypothetical protein